MTLLTKAHDSLPLMNSVDNPANAAKTAWRQLVVTITKPNLIAIVALCAIGFIDHDQCDPSFPQFWEP